MRTTCDSEYLTKGRLILVDGTLTASQWTDRGGMTHTQLSIHADTIAFVNAGRRDEQEADPKRAAAKGAKAKRNTPKPPQDVPEPNEKDMPF